MLCVGPIMRLTWRPINAKRDRMNEHYQALLEISLMYR